MTLVLKPSFMLMLNPKLEPLTDVQGSSGVVSCKLQSSTPQMHKLIPHKIMQASAGPGSCKPHTNPILFRSPTSIGAPVFMRRPHLVLDPASRS